MAKLSFWHNFKHPIIGLAPMDGITDPTFRYITDKYGKPDVLFTEFISTDTTKYNPKKVLNSLVRHHSNTPLIVQLYGNNSSDFYEATIFILKLGFSGIDINMGCPDRGIVNRGAGAGLINNPRLAKDIVLSVKKALKDFNKNNIPVSVKTRIGYDKPIIKEWIGELLETKPDVITIHGRTLKQMYSGIANWDEIAKAKEIAKDTNTLILGNGDIKSRKEGNEKAKKYNLDGVLIGRAAFGNPWVFQDKIPTTQERLNVMLEHCQMFTKLTPDNNFRSLRKHLSWYCKGFDQAASFRSDLMQVSNVEDVKKIIEKIRSNIT